MKCLTQYILIISTTSPELQNLPAIKLSEPQINVIFLLITSQKYVSTNILNYLFAGSFRVSLFIDLGCPRDLGKGWRGDLGTFMISRPP